METLDKKLLYLKIHNEFKAMLLLEIQGVTELVTLNLIDYKKATLIMDIYLDISKKLDNLLQIKISNLN